MDTIQSSKTRLGQVKSRVNQIGFARLKSASTPEQSVSDEITKDGPDSVRRKLILLRLILLIKRRIEQQGGTR